MELIKIAHDHYIIVDDSEIKDGDWYYDFYNQEVCQSTFSKLPIEFGNCKKITHSTQPLEEVRFLLRNESKAYFNKMQELSLQEVKELIGEVDVFNVVEKWSKSKEKFAYQYWNKPSFIEGYNQALKDNKEKKYTEEDVIRIVEKSRETGLTAEYLMMTFQPKTEWEVEIVDGKLTIKK